MTEPSPTMQNSLSEIIERLDKTGRERLLASPQDVPEHYMNVYARLSREDGALMLMACGALRALQSTEPSDVR